jgi:ribonuclease P protein component
MSSKNKRVTKELFQTIMKKGGMLSSPLFVFRYIPQKPLSYAVVAPKSVAKKAITRNKLKRQGYSALRAYPLPPLSGIFFYKKGAKNATFIEIKENVKVILDKIKL